MCHRIKEKGCGSVQDDESFSEIIKNINIELSYFWNSIQELLRSFKEIRVKLEKLDEQVQEQAFGSAYTYLGKALIIGGMVGAPSTFGLSVAICIFGHILIAYGPASEFVFSETAKPEIKDLTNDIHDIVIKLGNFNAHCRQVRTFYDSLCQYSSDHNCKYVYLLGTTLNELEIRFNAYLLHFENMEREEDYKQGAEKMSHNLDCNIAELIAFQQKISDIRKHLNQMKAIL